MLGVGHQSWMGLCRGRTCSQCVSSESCDNGFEFLLFVSFTSVLDYFSIIIFVNFCAFLFWVDVNVCVCAFPCSN